MSGKKNILQRTLGSMGNERSNRVWLVLLGLLAIAVPVATCVYQGSPAPSSAIGEQVNVNSTKVETNSTQVQQTTGPDSPINNADQIIINKTVEPAPAAPEPQK